MNEPQKDCYILADPKLLSVYFSSFFSDLLDEELYMIKKESKESDNSSDEENSSGGEDDNYYGGSNNNSRHTFKEDKEDSSSSSNNDQEGSESIKNESNYYKKSGANKFMIEKKYNYYCPKKLIFKMVHNVFIYPIQIKKREVSYCFIYKKTQHKTGKTDMFNTIGTCYLKLDDKNYDILDYYIKGYYDECERNKDYKTVIEESLVGMIRKKRTGEKVYTKSALLNQLTIYQYEDELIILNMDPRKKETIIKKYRLKSSSSKQIVERVISENYKIQDNNNNNSLHNQNNINANNTNVNNVNSMNNVNSVNTNNMDNINNMNSMNSMNNINNTFQQQQLQQQQYNNNNNQSIYYPLHPSLNSSFPNQNILNANQNILNANQNIPNSNQNMPNANQNMPISNQNINPFFNQNMPMFNQGIPNANNNYNNNNAFNLSHILQNNFNTILLSIITIVILYSYLIKKI